MNKYEVVETIGEGAYGVVLKCRNKETGEFVAIKRFKESEDDELVRKTTLREVKVLRMLKHETYVVHLIEAFRRKGKLYLVFEYVGCNLLDILDSHPSGVSLEDVRRMIFTMLLGCRACHANGVIHRDIKPENLLVHDDQTLRLCDFGFARPFTPGMDDLTDYVATRWYRSPELLLGTTNYGLPSDLWAVGCIMAELLDGQALFPGESELDQLFLIQKLLGNFTPSQVETFKNNKTFSGYALRDINRTETTLERKFGRKANKKTVHLLKSLLVIDPSKRLTIDETLQHPFFEGMMEIYAPNLKLSAPPVSIRPSTGERTHGSRSTPSNQPIVPHLANQQPAVPPAPVTTTAQQPQSVAPPIANQYVPHQAPQQPVQEPAHHQPPQGSGYGAPGHQVLGGYGNQHQQQPQASFGGVPQPTSSMGGAFGAMQHQHPQHQHQQHNPNPNSIPGLSQPSAYGVGYGSSGGGGGGTAYGTPQPTSQQMFGQQGSQGSGYGAKANSNNSSFLPPRVGSGHRRPQSQQWHPGMGGQAEVAPTAQGHAPPLDVNNSGAGYGGGGGGGGMYHQGGGGGGAPPGVMGHSHGVSNTPTSSLPIPNGTGSRGASRGDSRGNLPKLGSGRGNTGNGGMAHHGHYSSRLSSNASEASSGQGAGNPYKPLQMPPNRSSNRMFYNN